MRRKPTLVPDPLDSVEVSNQVDQLVCLTYQELKRIASRFLSEERRNHTLQPTALVHEAYLKLSKQSGVKWQGSSHFLRIAARAMRRILIDHARAKAMLKRGGMQENVSLDDVATLSEARPAKLIALDESLTRLAEIHPREAEIVELRIYGGLSVEQAAEVLKISPITVKRGWRFAKVWLYGDLKERCEAEAVTAGTGQDPI